MKSFEKLQEYFRKNKIRQIEISEKTGYSTSQVSKYFTGASLLTSDFIETIVECYPGIDLNFIFKENVNSAEFINEINIGDEIKKQSQKLEEILLNVKNIPVEEIKNIHMLATRAQFFDIAKSELGKIIDGQNSIEEKIKTLIEKND